MDISEKFIDHLGIDWAEPVDVVVVGSIAGYNWSKYSDIDLHVLYDFNDIDQNTDFVKKYCDAKKNEWNNQHEMLRIMGYDVETYVQDKGEENASDGIYSLYKDRWLQRPSQTNDSIDRTAVRRLSAKLINKADDLQ